MRVTGSPHRTPRRTLRHALAASTAAVVGLLAPCAFGQGAPGQPTLPSLDSQADEGVAKPFAEDLRAGHVLIRAESGLEVPFGQFQSGGSISDLAPYGVAVGGSLGVGVSRYAELDVSGAYALFHGTCDSCAASSVAASLGLSYHLAQGTSLDPWVRLGVGYRTMELSYDAQESTRFRDLPAGRYHALDIAKFTFGATYLPARGFGFGPWLTLGVGTVLAGPEPLDGRRAYGVFQLGARFEIDPVSWVGGSGASTVSAAPGAHAGTQFPPSPPSL